MKILRYITALILCGTLHAQNVNLNVTGPVGNLYVNEIYTGKQSPATISVPIGQIRIGIGNANGYYQKSINATASSNSIDLNGLHPCPRRVYKMAILPVRWISHGGEMAKLEDTDMELVTTTASRASLEEVLSGTYGLLEWKITTLPIVENAILQRGGDPGAVPDGNRLLTDAGLSNLYDTYDVVLLYYSVRKDGGARVQNGPCCIWGGWNMMFLDNGPRDDFRRDKNRYFGFGYTHEWLHGIEQRSRIYIEEGLHGAAAHGYNANANGGHDWMGWYRDFIRGTIPKIPGNTKEKTDYVGQFSFLKNWQRDANKDSDPIINVSFSNGTYAIKAVHSNRYVTIENGDNSSGNRILQADYTHGTHQQWNLTKVGEGIYTLISKQTGKSLDVNDNGTFNGDTIIQWNYMGGRNQKWHLLPVGNNQYKIISQHSGRGLDVIGGSMAQNAQVIQWDYFGGSNQKWVFEAVTVTGLQEAISEIQYNVYPNPTQGKLIFETGVVPSKIEIIDQFGQVVMSVVNNNNVDITCFPDAIYFARLFIGEQTSVVKVIKQ